MEQGILDASKYKISLVSLDSRFAEQKNGSNSEFQITSPIPLKNVIRIRMASIEIPLVEYTFSAVKGNLNFYVKVGANPNWVDTGNLIEGNYTATSLCAAVQNLLQNIHSGFTCSVNTVNGKVSIENPSVQFTINFQSRLPAINSRPTHWGLGYYLGYRDILLSGTYIPSTGAYAMVAPSIINVQPSPYYLLALKCPDEVFNITHSTANAGFIDAFAKVILRDNYYTIQFDDNSNLLRKEYTFLSPVRVPFFNLRLYDPWGLPVNMLDADWSVTLEITEVVNSRTYNTLATTYQRY
jgi:hypothetical protein